jgi:hypothetical protein
MGKNIGINALKINLTNTDGGARHGLRKKMAIAVHSTLNLNLGPKKIKRKNGKYG